MRYLPSCGLPNAEYISPASSSSNSPVPSFNSVPKAIKIESWPEKTVSPMENQNSLPLLPTITSIENQKSSLALSTTVSPIKNKSSPLVIHAGEKLGTRKETP